MSSTVRAVTARVPHQCEGCQWRLSLHGEATIRPGHRYLRHVAFPDGETNTGTTPWVVNECAACASAREQAGSLEPANTGACLTFCHGDTPCARPIRHDGDHECRHCRPQATPGRGHHA